MFSTFLLKEFTHKHHTSAFCWLGNYLFQSRPFWFISFSIKCFYFSVVRGDRVERKFKLRVRKFKNKLCHSRRSQAMFEWKLKFARGKTYFLTLWMYILRYKLSERRSIFNKFFFCVSENAAREQKARKSSLCLHIIDIVSCMAFLSSSSSSLLFDSIQ